MQGSAAWFAALMCLTRCTGALHLVVPRSGPTQCWPAGTACHLRQQDTTCCFAGRPARPIHTAAAEPISLDCCGLHQNVGQGRRRYMAVQCAGRKEAEVMQARGDDRWHQAELQAPEAHPVKQNDDTRAVQKRLRDGVPTDQDVNRRPRQSADAPVHLTPVQATVCY